MVQKDACLRLFKKIYPESPILKTWDIKDGIIIYTEHMGYNDYFKVTENFVSSAYSSLEDAKRD